MNISTLSRAQTEEPFFTGEKIIYAIKQVGMKAGEVTLEFRGRVEKNGRETYLAVFTSKGFNFYDREKIYMDPVTFLPLWVDRDLNIFGKKEQIVESYDQSSGSVTIIKTAAGATTTQTIDKGGTIDNIYCFIYRYRRGPKGFALKDEFTMNLPTADITFDAVKKETFSANDKKYEAIFIKSTPSKYKIWFDTSTERIPLRIDGAVGFGSTSMRMTQRSWAGSDSHPSD